jgi:hypothetical protein
VYILVDSDLCTYFLNKFDPKGTLSRGGSRMLFASKNFKPFLNNSFATKLTRLNMVNIYGGAVAVEEVRSALVGESKIGFVGLDIETAPDSGCSARAEFNWN